MNLFLNTIINLIVVLLCSVGLYLSLSYYNKSIKKSGGNLEVIERLHLDSRNILCLVRFREREILLAISGGAIQLLSIEPGSKEEKE